MGSRDDKRRAKGEQGMRIEGEQGRRSAWGLGVTGECGEDDDYSVCTPSLWHLSARVTTIIHFYFYSTHQFCSDNKLDRFCKTP
ncbi:hypothetical protein PoB_000652300 [Plakobranchus ocellatus]|uniref:Uncharacterized protein n=1 Tax=Plakobranchus ocellatus TaxID=259542 RepID=A0AAV3YCZ8_9GAST|nr:hypothetical protein PoB_000652300 [Plakobranchus ocellatus]